MESKEKQDLLKSAESAFFAKSRTNHRTFTIDGTVYLLSYRSIVAGYNPDTSTIHLFPYHDYSNTTCRHVYNFFATFKVYGLSAQVRRACFKHSYQTYDYKKVVLHNEQLCI